MGLSRDETSLGPPQACSHRFDMKRSFIYEFTKGWPWFSGRNLAADELKTLSLGLWGGAHARRTSVVLLLTVPGRR